MRHLAPFIIGAVLLVGCSSDEEPATGQGGTTGANGGAKATGGSRAAGGANIIAHAGRAGSTTTAASGGISSGGVAAGGAAIGGAAIGGAAIGGAAAGTSSVITSGGVDTGAGGSLTAGGAAGGSTVPNDTAGSAGSSGTAQGGAGGHAGAIGVAGAASGSAGTTNWGPAGSGNVAGTAGTASLAGMAGAAGNPQSWVPSQGCGAVRDSVRGWWSFDSALTSRIESGKALETVPSTATPSYVDGIAAGHALDASAGAFVEVNDDAFNVTGALTLSAFVKGASPDGRIIDRITPGGVDGYLLDVFGGHLRMIIGSRTVVSTAALSSPSTYTHVVGVFTGGTSPAIRLYVDGLRVDEATVESGAIPSNSLALRIGADQSGNNRFSGQIDEPMVFARALDDQEILTLRTHLLTNTCPTPEINSPANGLLLEHNESGVAQSGSLEHVRSNIRHAGDLRVLYEDCLYTCDWNAMPNEAVSNCSVWAPFAVTATTGNTFAPTVPLDWQLLRFNTTGLVDDLRMGVESSSQTLHARSSVALAWFGRDWRVQRFAVDSTGTATAGSLSNLAGELRAGAGLGVYLPGWGYSLPHFTLIVPGSGDHFTGLDPWHISSDYGSIPGEFVFQSNSYHYGVWFDTTSYWYASRWYFGTPGSISDSSGYENTSYFAEPGWIEVLAHDATGVVSAGSKTALRNAMIAGAAVRVQSPEGYYDCRTISGSGEAYCESYDTYVPVDAGGHFVFDGSHSRRLRRFSTLGTIVSQDWADHTASLTGSSEATGSLRWFVQRAGWALALQTTNTGAIVSGSVDNVIAAIRSGADVHVGRVGEGIELVRCDSVRVASNPARATCLHLYQRLGTAGAPVVPGYYEARVYNTNGVLARARVNFGSTENAFQDTSNNALAWYVRME